ncbi:MAG: hypothetical protein DYG99_00770 [Bacteroidetes bacterium CHB5]|nr:hypothetical protein [Bacteroidetes bacterium CHB5]
MHRIACLVTVWLCLSSFLKVAEGNSRLQLAVVHNGDSVGSLLIEQRVHGNKTTYTLTSQVSVQFLFQFLVEEQIVDVFNDGLLVHSSHQRHINGVLKATHALTRKADKYQVVDKDNRFYQLNEKILATVVSIYFHEPNQGQWVYSQNYKKLLPLEKTGEGCYRIQLPNGTTSKYRYLSGVLSEVETNTHIGTLKFINKHIER